MTSTTKTSEPTKGRVEWQKYYLDGKVIRRDDTPLSIIQTLEDLVRDTCSDQNDPLAEFVDGKPVDPRKLQQEIAACISENCIEKARVRLKTLEIWAIRECALAEAAHFLHDAQIAFDVAAHDVGTTVGNNLRAALAKAVQS